MVQLGIPALAFLLIWLSVKWISFLRTKNTNTALWATVFEGMTNYTVPQKPLQEPKVYIEKKVKRDGRDKES